MKLKLSIVVIVMALIALVYALKKGVFQPKSESYQERKLPEVVDFNFHIKPLLSDKCFTCHGPDANKRKAGLRLDIEANAFAELPENKGHFAIVKGDPNASILYQTINSSKPEAQMPPVNSNLKLTEYDKQLFKKWIQQGAKYDKHWAFIPPKKATLPTVKSTWGNNEIDTFVMEQLEVNNINPSQQANPETLIRRISLDLTGLPPKQEEIQELLKNNSKIEISKIIDTYLESTSYGEHMAQVWMDVARYADSHGYQDDSYRSMWPWRDWVINAFNKNVHYNQFLKLQLAGDLIPKAKLEDVLATGFNRNHPITQEGGAIQEEYQTYYVMDRTNTLGKGVLGLTLECAKCHDHKYDPISQKDYFQFYAFFNNVNEKGLQMDAVQAKYKSFFADPPLITLTDQIVKDSLNFINKPEGEIIKVMVMNDSLPRKSHILIRGEYNLLGEEVTATTPDIILPYKANLPQNRLGLSDWLTDAKNPLTARVFVNRLWAMLFGNGIVDTPDDFGVQGSLPTHPQLLDWLAVDFMEHDWDIKYLLKKIMLSATYQQSSIATAEQIALDPENKLLARASRFRMPGEMIRDYVLATSGLLNNKIGGPSVKPYQPPGLWEATNAGPDRGVLLSYVQDTGENLYRRSLYTFWKRTLPPPNMTIFDAPTRDLCEVKRQSTNTPLQALALQNDVQMLEAARVLAERTIIKNKNEDSEGIISDLFKTILIREPKAEELKTLNNYYNETIKTYNTQTDQANKLLAQGEYQRQDTDPVKTAALMLTAQVIYNLDETITIE